jgi:putative ABC transport system ATP-binding protein
MSTLISASSVSFTYGDGALETRVLRDLDVEIEAGEVTVLMGPSGSGKTTLISILAGLLRPSSGDVDLCGARITAMSAREVEALRRRALGFVFQAFHLFDALSALDNVAEVLALRAHISIREARARAGALLDALGLGDRLANKPTELSAGQRQRVAIARALSSEPRIVIADEPTVALDHDTAERVMGCLREYVGAETGLLLVTHDTRVVHPDDRVIEIEDGRVARVRRGAEVRR